MSKKKIDYKELSKKKIDYKELYENLYDQHVDLCIECSRLNTTIKTLIHMITRLEAVNGQLKSRDS